MKISERIKANEDSFAALFSKHIKINDNISRWQDDMLPDMYDLNDFDFIRPLSGEDLDLMEKYQRERGDSFVQFHCYEPQKEELWKPRGFEQAEILTMILTDGRGEDWKTNAEVTVKKLSEVKDYDEYIALELKNYGEIYGEDFTVRKTKRHCEMALSDNGYEFYFAYLNGKMEGVCHTYTDCGITCLDGLVVNPEARMKHVATTLLAAALKDTEYPFYLHADADDTPKEMYSRMGFEETEKLFIYNKKI